MKLNLIPQKLEGDLYQINESSDPSFLKKMRLLDFISEYNNLVLEKGSFFNSEKGIIVNYYQFKARKEKLYLLVSERDIPPSVFADE